MIVEQFRRTPKLVRVVGVVLAALALALTSACGAGGGGGGSSKSIRVLVEAGGHAELQPVANAFTKDTGIKVTFVELPYETPG